MGEINEKTTTILEKAREISIEENIELNVAIELLKIEALWKIVEYI